MVPFHRHADAIQSQRGYQESENYASHMQAASSSTQAHHSPDSDGHESELYQNQ